ncbi:MULTISPECIES: pilin [Rhodanobacter]|uniref:pilin n=1 Tax=Rhodanobacter TaxID=75309 RepID=UPI000260F829|nr:MULTISPECIES: pilin [Rhodanobacter]EIL97165.1 class II pilin PilE [Rhodanobacter thiooxydans LCS2]UJJ59239.1 pilin [Rhodanobacter denitrificans]
MKKMQKGFTLIELMIVVAIIAILAAIAIPAYQDYLIRTQVSEGAVLTDGAKTAVAEFYSNRGDLTNAKNASIGLAQAASIKGQYVSQVDVAGGIITASFAGPKANKAISTGPKTFVLSPVTSAGSISWVCTRSTVDQKYLPTSCRK